MTTSGHPHGQDEGRFAGRDKFRLYGVWCRLCLSVGLLVVLFAFGACKNRSAEDVLGKGEMVDLLYDYHLAQALAQTSEDSVDYKTRLYTVSVFRKYGITEQDFNRSMEYYSRHADQLYKIYERVNERFGSNQSATTGLAGLKGEKGDSMNVWNGRMFYLLSTKGQNYLEYEQPADTTFHAGDRVVWEFDTQWIYRDGAKSGVALITVTYKNDSVATVQRPLFGSGRQQLTAYLGDEPVKSIGCMIYQQSDWSDRPRLLVLTNMALVRIRAPKRSAKPVQPADSLKVPADGGAHAERRIRDSLLRADTAGRSHFGDVGESASRLKTRTLAP